MKKIVWIVTCVLMTGIASAELVGWWKFDEGSGSSIADSSTNSWPSGAVQGTAEWGAEEDGGGLHFNYASAATYVNFTGLDIGGGDAMSIAFWAKDDVISSYGDAVLAFWGLDGSSTVELKGYFPYNPATDVYQYQMQFGAPGSTGYDKVYLNCTLEERQARANEWHHWVFLKDAQQNVTRLYLDGVLVATGSGENSIASIATLRFGGNGGAANTYSGYLKDLRIYNHALSRREIASMLGMIVEEGMVGWWKFDEGSGSSIADSSGINWPDGAVIGFTEWGPAGNGGGLHFDYGSAATYVNFTDLDIGGGDAMSIAFWAKDDVITEYGDAVLAFWGMDSSSAVELKGYFPYNPETGVYQYQMQFGAPDSTAYNKAFLNCTLEERQGRANAWHHWVFQKDAQQDLAQIYLDGELVATGSGSLDVASIATLRFGGNGGAANTYSGYLKDLRVYSCLLSAGRVDEIIAATRSGYTGWAGGWGVDIGAATNDYDGDGLVNLCEYGLGGDPTNGLDQGTASQCGIVDVGGTAYFGYLHPQLSDANSGLSYSLEVCSDLVSGTWTNVGYTVYGTNVTGGDLDMVTNFTDTVDSQKFVRLKISM